jgi:hypothetical protein
MNTTQRYLEAEIRTLQERLATLEQQKNMYEDPLVKLEKFIVKKKDAIQNDRYTKSIPLLEFNEREKVEFLEPILCLLKNIDARLEVIENQRG